MSYRKLPNTQYKTINLRYINDKGLTVGYESVLVRKDLTAIIQQMNWQVKQWNKRNCVELEAVKAEEVITQNKLSKKVMATQLTLF